MVAQHLLVYFVLNCFSLVINFHQLSLLAKHFEVKLIPLINIKLLKVFIKIKVSNLIKN